MFLKFSGRRGSIMGVVHILVTGGGGPEIGGVLGIQEGVEVVTVAVETV